MPVEEHAERGPIGCHPESAGRGIGVGAGLGELGIGAVFGAERRGPAEQIHATVPDGADAADGVRDARPGSIDSQGLLDGRRWW